MNVIDLPVISTLNSDPDRILERAKGQLENVMVLGWNKDGDFFFGSSIANGPECLWLLELARKRLMED